MWTLICSITPAVWLYSEWREGRRSIIQTCDMTTTLYSCALICGAPACVRVCGRPSHLQAASWRGFTQIWAHSCASLLASLLMFLRMKCDQVHRILHSKQDYSFYLENPGPWIIKQIRPNTGWQDVSMLGAAVLIFTWSVTHVVLAVLADSISCRQPGAFQPQNKPHVCSGWFFWSGKKNS